MMGYSVYIRFFLLCSLSIFWGCSEEVKKEITQHREEQTVSPATNAVLENNEVISWVGESADSLAYRLRPDHTELVHDVITTEIWQPGKKHIIAFYGFDDPKDVNMDFNTITGYVYYPLEKDRYKRIKIGEYLEDGGYPEILSVFFANADKDEEKELIVLTDIPQRHYDYSGAFYETFIYDAPTEQSNELHLLDLSKHFHGSELSFRENFGEDTHTTFKTAKDIKKELKRLGF